MANQVGLAGASRISRPTRIDLVGNKIKEEMRCWAAACAAMRMLNGMRKEEACVYQPGRSRPPAVVRVQVCVSARSVLAKAGSGDGMRELVRHRRGGAELGLGVDAVVAGIFPLRRVEVRGRRVGRGTAADRRS